MSAIKYPGYMQSGMVNLDDPDGYHLEIGQWGKAEREAWLKRLAVASSR